MQRGGAEDIRKLLKLCYTHWRKVLWDVFDSGTIPKVSYAVLHQKLFLSYSAVTEPL